MTTTRATTAVPPICKAETKTATNAFMFNLDWQN